MFTKQITQNTKQYGSREVIRNIGIGTALVGGGLMLNKIDTLQKDLKSERDDFARTFNSYLKSTIENDTLHSEKTELKQQLVISEIQKVIPQARLVFSRDNIQGIGSSVEIVLPKGELSKDEIQTFLNKIGEVYGSVDNPTTIGFEDESNVARYGKLLSLPENSKGVVYDSYKCFFNIKPKVAPSINPR